MNDNINVGAYGWQHPHWSGGFYHEDLPPQWQLNYYSNVFNCVMVPAHYWHAEHGYDCETWIDDVHDDFVFYLELPTSRLTEIAKQKYLQQVISLQSRLAGLVINEDFCLDGNLAWLKVLADIAPLHLCDAAKFVDEDFKDKAVYQCWTDDLLAQSNMLNPSVAVGVLAVVHDDLADLRQCRHRLEHYFDSVNTDDVRLSRSIIVIQSDISASRLSQLCAVIEIMGL